MSAWTYNLFCLWQLYHMHFLFAISQYIFSMCYASKSTTFLENFQNSRHKKNPGKSRLSEVLIVFCIRLKLSFRELRSSTSCFETVLHETEARFCLILRGFSSFLLFVHQFLNPRFCRLLSDFNPNLFLMCRLLC